MQQFNQFRTYAEGENMPITEDGIPGVMARNGGLPMRNGGALSAAARKVQSAGFGEDKILVHINPAEYAELIRKHGPVTYNDETGLPQLGFFKSLGKILKIAAPIILSVALPGLGTAIGVGIGLTGTAAAAVGGAILGAGTGFATSGGKLKGALTGGALGGFGGYLQGASSLGGLSADQYKDLTFAQKAMVGNNLGFLGATDPAKAAIAARPMFGAIPGIGVDPALAAKFAPAAAPAAPPSFLDSIVGKSQLTSSVLNPAMKGLPALLTSPAGIMAGGYLIDALGNKKATGTGTGTGQPINYPLAPGQTKPYSSVPGPNIVAPTLQRMAAVPQSQDVQLPDGRIVPASYLQNGILNFTGQQNDYTQSSNPVFARTGGLAQVKRYEDGGTVTPAPFVPTRRVLTAPELQAQGMDFEHYGEKPRPVGMQSFYTPYTTAPVAPTPTAPTTPTTPTTPNTPVTPPDNPPSNIRANEGVDPRDSSYVYTGTDTSYLPKDVQSDVRTWGNDAINNLSADNIDSLDSNLDNLYKSPNNPVNQPIYINPYEMVYDGTVGRSIRDNANQGIENSYSGNTDSLNSNFDNWYDRTVNMPINIDYGSGTNSGYDWLQRIFGVGGGGDKKGGFKKASKKQTGALSQVSRYVSGDGDGQADKIPAMLSDGEYVMDAESVSALGNGSSKAGAKRLDEFRMNLRKHKRSAPVGKIPPKTKKLNKYMSGGSR